MRQHLVNNNKGKMGEVFSGSNENGGLKGKMVSGQMDL